MPQVSILVYEMLGAIRHQAITWAIIEQDQCHHLMPLSHTELIYCNQQQKVLQYFIASHILMEDMQTISKMLTSPLIQESKNFISV